MLQEGGGWGGWEVTVIHGRGVSERQKEWSEPVAETL